MIRNRWLPVVVVATAACAGMHRPLAPHRAIRAAIEVPAAERLDVAIEVFSLAPRSPAALPPEVRRLEARLLPYHLKTTLESTGWWGVVRVVPPGTATAEVRVRGTILRSDGRDLELRVAVEDAAGRPWLGQHYGGRAIAAGDDPHQPLFARIADDLLSTRRRLDRRASQQLRATATLRFAADLAPDAFGRYLHRSSTGRYRIDRLPAEGDPVMARIDRIRAHDEQLVDGLDEFYAALFARAGAAHADWRRRMAAEAEAVDSLNHTVRARRVFGAVAIAIGGALLASAGGARWLSAGGIGVGTTTILSGGRQKAETRLHLAAAGEMAADLEEEVEPLLVVVEDRTVALEGTVEEQYRRWRELLRGIVAIELGPVGARW